MSASRGVRIAIATLVAGVLAAGLLVAVGVVFAPSSANASEQVFLEASGDVGVAPFVPAAGVKNPAATNQPGVDIETLQCDPRALVSALQGDLSLATAWTEALNTDSTLSWTGGTKVRPDQVAAYIGELTPKVLSEDIRVTNFQYRNGAPTSVQSVLQAGSSVLVDRAGVVRVRCKCGNPLTPMRRLQAPPVYHGQSWDGVEKIKVVIECEDEQVFDDGACRDRCPEGYYHHDGDCRPIPCDQGQERRDGKCRDIECPDDQHLVDGKCRRIEDNCPDGQERHDGKCRPIDNDRCPDGQHRVDGKCQDNPQCRDDQHVVNGQCQDNPQCRDDQHVVNGQCEDNPPCPNPAPDNGVCAAQQPQQQQQPQCQAGQVVQNGACVPDPVQCPAGQVAQNGACVPAPVQCPAGQVVQNGACVPAPVQCPAGQVAQNGACVPAPPRCLRNQVLDPASGLCVPAPDNNRNNNHNNNSPNNNQGGNNQGGNNQGGNNQGGNNQGDNQGNGNQDNNNG